MGLGVYVRRGEKMTKLQAEINAAVAANKPFIFKANTIEALATKMHLPVDQQNGSGRELHGLRCLRSAGRKNDETPG
ncbi:hypothetical protein WP50_31545 [Lactiplantibacillus plantarum]|nr:hypothetical protein WP50_31545 [Lactiplantibacillus plantarum]